MAQANFTREHFKLLNKWKGTVYDKTNPEQERVYAELCKAYDVTKNWAEALQERLFPNGWTKTVRKPTDQWQKRFTHYNWARVYPSRQSPEGLAYTVGIDSELGFVVKIDLIDLRTEDSSLRPKYEQIRGPITASPIVAIKSASEGLALDFTSLVEWSVEAIGDFKPSYGEVAEKLQLSSSQGSTEAPENNQQVTTAPYTIDDILGEGCFLDREELERLLDRLQAKKNLILQGPPGTGKTWLAKRLGFALIGRKDDRKLRAVQFHPNLSYEDFVRGWRPTGEGKLSLADGVFMEAIKAALGDPGSEYVIVIEEINRGNPAQIFGELLTLLEASKRKPSEALELCYPDADGSRRPVHIPANLYVIGTMNIADRSLALVDLALRRRFAFVGLEPKLGGAWRNWVVKECGIDPTVVDDIEKRMTSLNDVIAADPRLGKQFRVGHSYVTPNHRLEAGETKEWFRQVVDTEIGPLLEEYWFDAPNEAQKARERLAQGW